MEENKGKWKIQRKKTVNENLKRSARAVDQIIEFPDYSMRKEDNFG